MDDEMQIQRSSYGRFGAMIGTSTIVMFVLMYLNSYALDHVFYSQTRTWMAVYMGAGPSVMYAAKGLEAFDQYSEKASSKPAG